MFLSIHSLFKNFKVKFLLISLFLFIFFNDSRLQCLPTILARMVVSLSYFSIAFSIFRVKLLESSLFSIKISSISSLVNCIFSNTFSNDFLVLSCSKFSFLKFINAIAISGAVDESVIVMLELPFIVRDPIAFALNL